MTRRALIALLLGTVSTALGACGRSIDTLRYRFTVEVDTPQGLRSGSSVQELVHGGEIGWLPGGNTFTTNPFGEAVAVDLPGGTLFTLIQPSPDWLLCQRYCTAR